MEEASSPNGWSRKRCREVRHDFAEIETDKATMEFEAVDEGKIANPGSPKAPRA